MRTNGPLALIFHAIFVVVMLAPIVVVCLVAFTPEGYLSLPTTSFSLRWFRTIANYPEFVHAFWVSLGLGALSSLVALLFGGNSGLVNKALASLGLISAPLPFMFTETGMVVALAHVLMPYMVLAVWAALQRLDPQIENAAVALGAGPFTVLRRIVLPQVMPGILSGAIIVFALAASAFATPAIIGGRRLKVAATLAYDEFLNTLNWPLGAAVAVLLLVALVLIVVGASRLVERRYAQVFG